MGIDVTILTKIGINSLFVNRFTKRCLPEVETDEHNYFLIEINRIHWVVKYDNVVKKYNIKHGFACLL